MFSSTVATALGHRNVARRGFEPARLEAGLDADDRPRLRFHDLRHTFASMLIAQGHDVLFVSRQLGHSSVKVTLDTYGHLFDAQRHAERMRMGLEDAFGITVRDAFLGGEVGEGAKVAQLCQTGK